MVMILEIKGSEDYVEKLVSGEIDVWIINPVAQELQEEQIYKVNATRVW
jgi:hypothetical protein